MLENVCFECSDCWSNDDPYVFAHAHNIPVSVFPQLDTLQGRHFSNSNMSCCPHPQEHLHIAVHAVVGSGEMQYRHLRVAAEPVWF